MFNAFDRRDRFDLVTVVAAFYHLQDFCEALERLRGLVATGGTLATLGVAHSSTPEDLAYDAVRSIQHRYYARLRGYAEDSAAKKFDESMTYRQARRRGRTVLPGRSFPRLPFISVPRRMERLLKPVWCVQTTLYGDVVEFPVDSCQEGCASVCLRYADPADGEVVRELAARGFARFPSMRSCSIEVSWSSFDDYLQSVPSRRRVRIHRERRAVEESGLVIMEEPLTEELARESEVLKGNIDAKYHGEEARQPLTEISYSLMLARECPDKTFAVTARDADGTLRGQRRGHVCGRNPGLGDVGRRLRGVWQTAALL